jgi:hypothetical protein
MHASSRNMFPTCACLSPSPLLWLMHTVQLMTKMSDASKNIFRVYHIKIIAPKKWFTRHQTDRFLNNYCQECVRAYPVCMSDNLPERVQILGHAHIIYITVRENRIICCQIICDLLLKSVNVVIFAHWQLTTLFLGNLITYWQLCLLSNLINYWQLCLLCNLKLSDI